MTIDEVKAHAQKFSQTYRKGSGIWKDNFEAMAKKTCLKRLLTKWAPKSLEMNMLQTFDQSVVKGDIRHLEEAEAQYPDNSNSPQNTEGEYVDIEEVNDGQKQEETPKHEEDVLRDEMKDPINPHDDLEF